MDGWMDRQEHNAECKSQREWGTQKFNLTYNVVEGVGGSQEGDDCNRFWRLWSYSISREGEQSSIETRDE